jgi:hypothetical protein
MTGKNRYDAEAALRSIAAKVSVNMLNHNNGAAGVGRIDRTSEPVNRAG